MSEFCHFTDIYSIGQMSEYVLFYGHLSYRLDVYRSDGVTPTLQLRLIFWKVLNVFWPFLGGCDKDIGIPFVDEQLSFLRFWFLIY